MSKKPQFRLYRIVDKRNGKAMQSIKYDGSAYWTDLGCFYRSLDTIKKHLRTITHKHEYIISKCGRYGSWCRKEEIKGRKEHLIVEAYSVIECTVKELDSKDLI